MARALFLVSTGRTATTWLEHFFASAGARARHEPGPRVIRHVSHAYASGHLGDARARELVHRWRDSDVAAGPAPYVEASTLVYGLVRPILDAFPEAAVVHVVRNPLTFLRSGVNWGQYRNGGRILNVLPFRPWWDVRARMEWARTDQFGRLCWAWTALNRATREQGRGDTRYSVVHYEDLFDATRGKETLRGLLARVDLALDEAQLDALRTTTINEHKPNWYKPDRCPRWPEWTAERLRQVVAVCGDEARCYGYELAAEIAQRRPEVAAV
jgi:hypothetical protein